MMISRRPRSWSCVLATLLLLAFSAPSYAQMGMMGMNPGMMMGGMGGMGMGGMNPGMMMGGGGMMMGGMGGGMMGGGMMGGGMMGGGMMGGQMMGGGMMGGQMMGGMMGGGMMGGQMMGGMMGGGMMGGQMMGGMMGGQMMGGMMGGQMMGGMMGGGMMGGGMMGMMGGGMMGGGMMGMMGGGMMGGGMMGMMGGPPTSMPFTGPGGNTWRGSGMHLPLITGPSTTVLPGMLGGMGMFTPMQPNMFFTPYRPGGMSMGGGGGMGMGGGMMGGGMMGGGMMGGMMGGGMMGGQMMGGMGGMRGGMGGGMGGMGMQMMGGMGGGMMMGGMGGMMGGMQMMGGMMGGMQMMGGMGGMGGMMGGMQMMGGMGMMGCHPGCFPAGSLVSTTTTPRKIEEIKAGDYVLGVDKKGKTHRTKVRSAFTTENYLYEIKTDSGTLVTTGKQPLCTSCGCVKTAGNDLEPGDELLHWVDGKAQPTKVLAVKKTDRLVTVFNLVLEDQPYYVVCGFQVRSKPPLEAEATAQAEPAISALPPERSRK